MNPKRKLAMFPVFADTLSVVRYYKYYRPDVEIVELISPPGSCACGKDAGFLDNREKMGITVISPDESNPNNWDELCLLYHSITGLTDDEAQAIIYDPEISIAKENNKSINAYNDDFESIYDKHVENLRITSHILNQVKKFVVLVGGVIGEANSFEVFLSLYGELKKRVRTVAFSSSPNAEICGVNSFYKAIHTKSYSESEKVFVINQIILDAVKKSDADLVIIHIEEAMMSFSNALTNGFGIIPYMISQILSPDFFICCLPCDCASPEFIKEFSVGLDGRFCFSPDVWHISNALLDNSHATELQNAHAVYAPIDSIDSLIQKNKSMQQTIGSFVNKAFLFECINRIVDDWKSSQIVEVVN